MFIPVQVTPMPFSLHHFAIAARLSPPPQPISQIEMCVRESSSFFLIRAYTDTVSAEPGVDKLTPAYSFDVVKGIWSLSNNFSYGNVAEVHFSKR